jgi:hypothetical protein
VIPGAGWVDMLSRVVVQVGFPVVVAAVLLWFLLTRFQENMDLITTRMGNNTQVVATLIAREESAITELQKQGAELSVQTGLMRELVAEAVKVTNIREEELRLLDQINRGQKEKEKPNG